MMKMSGSTHCKRMEMSYS